MAVTVMCGRIGAIVGNVIFGALVDEHCVVPIYMFGTLLISKDLYVYLNTTILTDIIQGVLRFSLSISFTQSTL